MVPEKLQTRNENLRVLNYANMDFPDEYFRDTGHMSLKGAQVFSSVLNKDVKRILEEQ